MASDKPIPLLSSALIETHCHLDSLKEGPIAELLEKTRQQGIEQLITISTSPENYDTVLEYAKTYPDVYCTQGVHPHSASQWSTAASEHLIRNAAHSKVVAIGEIGLDYHYYYSTKEQQIVAFKEQLEIAIKLDLPVVIHSRDADEDMEEILNEMAPRMNKKGVIHSFTSGEQLARTALALGFHLGFNGIITFNNAQNVRDVLKLTPLDKILFETDAPYLTPTPYRGRPNAPFYLPMVALKVAEVKEIKLEELLPIVHQNSQTLFGLPAK